MFLDIEQRQSDSPYIERVWNCFSNDGGVMTSIASPNWDLVFWKHAGRVHVTVHGPETKATRLPTPAGAEFFGITFALGSAMPHMAPRLIVDGAIDVPDPTARSFHLAGSSWQRPGYDTAEDFVARLVREEIVVRDPLVPKALRTVSVDVTRRTVQRRFREATGLSPGAVRQIQRARHAAVLLSDGHDVADVVDRLGYYDGPHLRHALTRFIGWTPSRLRDPDPADQLSLLYTT